MRLKRDEENMHEKNSLGENSVTALKGPIKKLSLDQG